MFDGSTLDMNEAGVTGNISVWVDAPQYLTATWQSSGPTLHLVAAQTVPSQQTVNVILTDGTGAGYDFKVQLTQLPSSPMMRTNPIVVDMQHGASQQIQVLDGTANTAFGDGTGVVQFTTSPPWMVTAQAYAGSGSVTYTNTATYTPQAGVVVTVGAQP